MSSEAQTAADKFAELDRKMQQINDHADKRADSAFEMTKERLKREGTSKEELLKLENAFLQGKIEISKRDGKIAEAARVRDLILAEDDKKRKEIQAKFDADEIKRKEERNGFRVQIEKNLTSAFDIEEQKREERRNKSIQKQEQDAAKIKALREKELGELKKGRDDAYLETLTDQEAELYKTTEHYVNLIELAIKYGQDSSIFEEALLIKLQEIRDKYRKEEQEKIDKDKKDKKDKEDKEVEEFLKRQQEADQFRFEQYNKIKELNQQRVDEELRQNQVIGQSWVSLGNNIASVFGALANTFSDNEVLQKAFAVAQVAINTAASIGAIILSGKQQQADYNKAIAAGNSTILVGIANAFIPGFQGIAAAQIASGKAAVGAAIAGKATAKANTAIQIGTAAAVGGLQIAAILSAKKPSAPSAGGGGDTGSGGAGTPAFTTPTIGAPQIGPTGAQQGQLAAVVAGALDRNNSQGRPIRAYVVGNDITSEQQLQRRLRAAARLGG